MNAPAAIPALLAHWPARIVGALFVYAAIAKCIAPAGARGALAYLLRDSTLADPGAQRAAFVLLVGIEAAVGAALLARPASRAALALAAAMLAGFIIFLGMLLWDPAAPACGCFGLVSRSAAADATVGLIRNAAALWMLAYVFVNSRPAETRRAPRASL